MQFCRENQESFSGLKHYRPFRYIFYVCPNFGRYHMALLGAATGLAFGCASAMADDVQSTLACDRAAGSITDPSRPAGIAGLGYAQIDGTIALRACQAALAAAPGNLRVMTELGRTFLAMKDFEKARLYLMSAANQGYPDAQLTVGMLYAQVDGGLPKDDREAARFYKLAADQGHPWAQGFLAEFYLLGRGGLPKNGPEAFRLAKLSADQGIDFSQFTLGEFYDHGFGVARDHAQAVSWYRKAAEQGNALAREELAKLGEDSHTLAQETPAPLEQSPADVKEIKLTCEDQMFVFISPAQKFVRVHEHDGSILEFKDGVFGNITTGLQNELREAIAKRMGVSPGLQQSVFIGENFIRFGAESKDGSYKTKYSIDRRSGLLAEDNDPPRVCTVLPNTKPF